MTKQPVQRDQACLLITRFVGFGDLVFHTPTIRVLSSLFRRLDVWSVQTEPFLNSPRIHELRRIPSGIGMPDVPQGVYAKSPCAGTRKQSHSGIHTIDMVSLNAIGHVLRPQAKDLEMFWTAADEKVAGSLLAGVAGPIIVVSPAVNWPSRTFPLILAIAFIIGQWGADLAWLTLVSASIHRGRFVLNETYYRWILGLCRLLLIGFGLYYLVTLESPEWGSASGIP